MRGEHRTGTLRDKYYPSAEKNESLEKGKEDETGQVVTANRAGGGGLPVQRLRKT